MNLHDYVLGYDGRHTWVCHNGLRTRPHYDIIKPSVTVGGRTILEQSRATPALYPILHNVSSAFSQLYVWNFIRLEKFQTRGS